MANFELTIDDTGFKRVGVKTYFHEEVYGELLDEFTVCNLVPRLKLRPHMGWGLSTGAKALRNLQHPSKYTDYGEYDEGTLDIVCVPDVEETNNNLLHETKHLIDDSSGDLHDADSVMKRRRTTVAVAMVASEVTASLTLNSDYLLATSGLVAISGVALMRHYGYTAAPYEIAAREFAENPEILEAYGHIISYSQSD